MRSSSGRYPAVELHLRLDDADQKDQPGAGLTYAHRPGDVVGTPPDRYAG